MERKKTNDLADMAILTGASEQSDERLLALLLGERDLERVRKMMPSGRVADLEFAVLRGSSERERLAFARASAFVELAERLGEQRHMHRGITIKGAEDIARITRHGVAERNESFWLVCTDSADRLIACKRIITGDQTKINFNPRLVIEEALAHKAYRVAFVHNHPDGNAKPSGNDHQAMLALYGVCHSVSLHVKDSVIVAANGYYSFASRELRTWDRINELEKEAKTITIEQKRQDENSGKNEPGGGLTRGV